MHKKSGKDLKPQPISVIDKHIVTKIDCGIYHSVALTSLNILFSWGGGGSNYNKGQLGLDTHDDVQYPKPIVFFEDKKVVDFACGELHTLAITEDK